MKKITAILKKNRTIIKGIFWILGICLVTWVTSYVIHILPADHFGDMKGTLATMFASLCGGLLTLFGVDLTINNAEKSRKIDAIDKAKPYLNIRDLHGNTEYLSNCPNTDKIELIGECDWSNDQSLIFEITNISEALFLYKNIKIDGKNYGYWDTARPLAKHDKIIFSYTASVEHLSKIETIVIFGQDVLGNKYKYDVFIQPPLIVLPLVKNISLPTSEQ